MFVRVSAGGHAQELAAPHITDEFESTASQLGVNAGSMLLAVTVRGGVQSCASGGVPGPATGARFTMNMTPAMLGELIWLCIRKLCTAWYAPTPLAAPCMAP